MGNGFEDIDKLAQTLEEEFCPEGGIIDFKGADQSQRHLKLLVLNLKGGVS